MNKVRSCEVQFVGREAEQLWEAVVDHRKGFIHVRHDAEAIDDTRFRVVCMWFPLCSVDVSGPTLQTAFMRAFEGVVGAGS